MSKSIQVRIDDRAAVALAAAARQERVPVSEYVRRAIAVRIGVADAAAPLRSAMTDAATAATATAVMPIVQLAVNDLVAAATKQREQTRGLIVDFLDGLAEASGAPVRTPAPIAATANGPEPMRKLR